MTPVTAHHANQTSAAAYPQALSLNSLSNSANPSSPTSLPKGAVRRILQQPTQVSQSKPWLSQDPKHVDCRYEIGKALIPVATTLNALSLLSTDYAKFAPDEASERRWEQAGIGLSTIGALTALCDLTTKLVRYNFGGPIEPAELGRTTLVGTLMKAAGATERGTALGSVWSLLVHAVGPLTYAQSAHFHRTQASADPRTQAFQDDAAVSDGIGAVLNAAGASMVDLARHLYDPGRNTRGIANAPAGHLPESEHPSGHDDGGSITGEQDTAPEVVIDIDTAPAQHENTQGAGTPQPSNNPSETPPTSVLTGAISTAGDEVTRL